MSYVLVTPIKDEAQNLHQLHDTVLSQTLLPVLWIIVDSFSDDGSFDRASALFETYPWVHVIRQKHLHEEGYSYINMSAAINDGYSYAKHLAEKTCTAFSYVGKTDATPLLKENYFERLHSEMEKNPTLAITCGTQKILRGTKTRPVKPLGKLSYSAFNDIRLYRRGFFEEIGGYSLTRSPDTVALVKATRRGWKSKIVETTYFTKPRLGGAKRGLWRGNESKGRAMYELGYHPLLFLFNAVTLSVLFYPHYQVLPMTLGYISSAIARAKRIDDDEILAYFWHERLKEVLHELH